MACIKHYTGYFYNNLTKYSFVLEQFFQIIILKCIMFLILNHSFNTLRLCDNTNLRKN